MVKQGLTCDKCYYESPMKEILRNQPSVVNVTARRCARQFCRAAKSIREWNAFFYNEDATGHATSCLSLSVILEIVYGYLYSRSTVDIH